MTDEIDVLVHLCTAAEWSRIQGGTEYMPESFNELGFVHLSTPEQVHLPANRLFAGRTDMVLLTLDPQRLNAPVRWEPGVPSDPKSMLFPHLYGPLPLGAVDAAVEYRPGPGGDFGPPVL